MMVQCRAAIMGNDFGPLRSIANKLFSSCVIGCCWICILSRTYDLLPRDLCRKITSCLCKTYSIGTSSTILDKIKYSIKSTMWLIVLENGLVLHLKRKKCIAQWLATFAKHCASRECRLRLLVTNISHVYLSSTSLMYRRQFHTNQTVNTEYILFV